MRYEKFKDCKATYEFLIMFNDLFDILNSKSKFGYGNSAPLSTKNYAEWSVKFENARNYILSLKDFKGVPLINGPRKNAFLGFIATMKSFQYMYQTYVLTGHLTYLSTFKFSQDHVEFFFGAIRASLGCNNNPTTYQFKASYKKLLLGATHKTSFGNALIDYDVAPIPSLHTNVNDLADFYDLNCDWTNMYFENCNGTNEYKDDILTYVAGFVTRRLISKENCKQCKEFLLNCRIRKSCDLLNLKNRGGLVTPGVHIDLIIKTANQLLETVKSEKNIYSEKNIIEKMYVNVKRILDVKQHNFLSFLDEHTDIMNSGSHRALLIKKVVSIFLTLRLKHMAKLKNLSLTNKRIRKTYSKLILFKSQ